jgi:hypothetical protein
MLADFMNPDRCLDPALMSEFVGDLSLVNLRDYCKEGE